MGDFVTKLLCNLLLISCTKLFDAGSGWANFGGEGGAKPNYQKIHSTIRHGRWIFWNAPHCTRMSIAGQAILLVGPSLPPNKALYFGFRPGSFRKWYLLTQPTFFAKKWSPMSSIVSNFRSSDEQGWRNRQTMPGSLLHSCPLLQNWIQTFSRKSQGKISFIFIFGLVSLNIPMSDWAHFTVSLVTTRRCFFWHWTRDGFDLPSGVVVLCLSPAEVQGTLSPLAGTGLEPGMLDWWGASGQALLQEFVLFQGFKVWASMEDAMVAMGIPREWWRMILSLNALIVVMAQIKGWMFRSKMGRFSDATFTLPKLVAKLAMRLRPSQGRNSSASEEVACGRELHCTIVPTLCCWWSWWTSSKIDGGWVEDCQQLLSLWWLNPCWYKGWKNQQRIPWCQFGRWKSLP